MQVHWLDADVLIQAKNKYYQFDMVPMFWQFLDSQAEAGTIRMSKLVYNEIINGNDELASWCKKRKNSGFCVSPSQAVQEAYKRICEHVSNNCPPHHLADFLKGADGWVIAHAMAGSGIVVTEELTTGSASKIKVPIVAKELGVPWCDTFKMLKTLGAKFG